MVLSPFRPLLAPVRLLFAPARLLFQIVALVVGGLVLYFAVTWVQVWLTSRHFEPRPAQAIVVMGAAQYNGVPSPDLRARLDEALTLFRRGYAHLVVVTGAKQPGDRFTEAQTGADYLMSHGIPTTDVLQSGGKDSYENLATAAGILKQRRDTRVLMVTDPFHEYRSMAIASGFGLRSYPTPTKSSPIHGWASVPYFFKEVADVTLGRVIGYHWVSQIHADVG